MRLLVGTLYSGEAQFADCCKAIRQQTFDSFEHLVIRDLPKNEAHETLYGTFMRRADEFDLLVKVDADLVLGDVTLFGNIVDAFSSDPELDLLLIAVHDFFTDGLLMAGLQIFRNTVVWNLGKESLFTDMTYAEESVRKKVSDYRDLAPAGIHCPDPDSFQAFHYGFHRGMKAAHGAGRHWKNLSNLCKHFDRSDDPRLSYAVLGADLALNGRYSVQHISYTDQTVERRFQEGYAGADAEDLNRRARRSKVFWLCKLPINRRLISKYYRTKSRWLVDRQQA